MSIEEIGKIVIEVKEYSLAIPILFGFYYFINNRLTRNLIVLLSLLVLFIPMELISIHYSKIDNNLFFNSTIRVIGLLLYIVVFYLSTVDLIRRRLYILLSAIYCSVLILEILLSPRDLFLQYANFLFNITLIVASISCLLEIIEKETEKSIIDLPMFWISAGLLINNSVLLITLFVNNYFIEHEMMNELWISYITKLLFGIILYIFFAIGFWKSSSNLVNNKFVA